MPEPKTTLPVAKFLVSNANSTVPLGPLPTSQILVSNLSPGLTGAVNRTPKNLRELGSCPPTDLSTARHAKP